MSEVTGKNRVRLVTVDKEYQDQRLDNFLLRYLQGVPRSYIYRIIRKGEVRVNKGRIAVKYRLQAGDIVRIPPVREARRDPGKPHNLLLRQLENSILYEDNSLIVINKPSGIAVHGGSGISFGVIETLRALRPDESHLELAHRLDRDTSGCLMITKKRAMLKTLHELQQKQAIRKKYLALVSGNWGKKTALEIDVPLKKNIMKGGERLVQVDAAGKDSCTLFELKERFDGCQLVEATLKTGRTHQIRVHCTYAGTPIIGDEKYGRQDVNREFRKRGLHRLFLHARSLKLRLPDSGRLLKFDAPLDSELEALLEKLRQ